MVATRPSRGCAARTCHPEDTVAADEPTAPHPTGGKAAARAAGLAARAAIDSAHRAAATRAIVDRLEAVRQHRRPRTVSAYAATGTEVVIDDWLSSVMAEGVGVFLPLVRGRHLQLVRVRDLVADLRPGHRGVREPDLGGRRPARVERIDTFVVPGAAFDERGGRLGYGGGHFDRLLSGAAANACLIGVAFEAQVVGRVPAEDHDVAMDLVVTERRTIRCR